MVWLAHAPVKSKSCDDLRDGNAVSSGGFVAELHIELQEAGGISRVRASIALAPVMRVIATTEKSPSSRRPTKVKAQMAVY